MSVSLEFLCGVERSVPQEFSWSWSTVCSFGCSCQSHIFTLMKRPGLDSCPGDSQKAVAQAFQQCSVSVQYYSWNTEGRRLWTQCGFEMGKLSSSHMTLYILFWLINTALVYEEVSHHMTPLTRTSEGIINLCTKKWENTTFTEWNIVPSEAFLY